MASRRARDAFVPASSDLEERWPDGRALGRLIDGGASGGADAEFALWRVLNLKL